MKRVLCLVFLLLSLVACTEATSEGNTNTGDEETSVEEQVADTEEVLFENDQLKATFVEVLDQFGFAVMVIKMENKTDGELAVIPFDTSVDNEMKLFVWHMTQIQPHKSYDQGVTIGQELPTDNVEFKLRVVDGNFHTMFETDVIRIDMKK